MKINENYKILGTSYIFTTIGRKAREYSSAHPEAKLIRLGIGDVTRPLVPAVIEAMQKAVAEMGSAETFRGYGEEQGCVFLRECIARYYAEKNVKLAADEIFVSDGAKSDLGNILDLFDAENTVAVPNPVYPVYVDTNIMAGRKLLFLNGTEKNGFLPMPGEDHADIIYICSPNNPTGAVYSFDQLKKWVDYAVENSAVILFDAAYEAFVSDEALPTSIYQIPGAKSCAIEFCSFSKTAGFTGTRCGYTSVPHELVFDGMELNKMWLRRQTTKFNGVPYIVQRGAEAAYSAEGIRQNMENIAYYKENARIIADALEHKGIEHWGGSHSPYIWLKCPDGMGSWDFFDMLLEKYNIIGTPGEGFGSCGEGYFRLTAFGTRENTQEAMQRLTK